ncbi:DMT family transporter [Corynebacterium terpenotabidum]|uniref:Quaternary ammonium compound-resistance protein n=1 Tax=Corynebacterium terpenotabidum Y-11 TaxID=1200352 RepID=S4XCS0_9CORY|nr:SMR family transporter [Corynebacterium terpenotabidum]AGP30319.1 quaternary ammonium compound-resistance protein [Corynebacterium terpenotabidum Y-11]
MAWVVLVVSGLFEAVWATALGRIDGWSRITPIVVFIAGLTASMAGLAWAMRTLPTGTSYAVWVAIGAVATVGVAAVLGDENLSVAKVVFLVIIIGGVIGLKTVS